MKKLLKKIWLFLLVFILIGCQEFLEYDSYRESSIPKSGDEDHSSEGSGDKEKVIDDEEDIDGFDDNDNGDENSNDDDDSNEEDPEKINRGYVIREDTCSYVKIIVAGNNDSDSNAEFLTLFIKNFSIRLYGDSSQPSFGKEKTYIWELDRGYLKEETEAIPQDHWDYLSLKIEGDDDLEIGAIKIVHNCQKIYRTLENFTLSEKSPSIGLSSLMREYKEDYAYSLGITPNNTLVAALGEIGKTDWDKYDSSDTYHSWCTEFSAWALRHGGLNPPEGKIGINSMKDYFSLIEKWYTEEQVRNGEYRIKPGDYIAVDSTENGDANHSGIFIGWENGEPEELTDSTKFRYVSGNASGKSIVDNTNVVKVRENVPFLQIKYVGDSQ